MFGEPKVFEGMPCGREARLAAEALAKVEQEIEGGQEPDEPATDDLEADEALDEDEFDAEPPVAAVKRKYEKRQHRAVGTSERIAVPMPPQSDGENPVVTKTERWLESDDCEQVGCDLCDELFDHQRVCIARDVYGTKVMCEPCAMKAGYRPPSKTDRDREKMEHAL